MPRANSWVLLLLVWCGVVGARCPDPPQQFARSVVEDAKAKAGTIGPVTGAEVDSRTEVLVNDLTARVPNLDKSRYCETVQSIACDWLNPIKDYDLRVTLWERMTAKCYALLGIANAPPPPPSAIKKKRLTDTKFSSKNPVVPPSVPTLGVVPIGTIVAWSGPVAALPENWKVANGDSVPNKDYPELCKVLGTRWGSADSFTCTLPDLQGVFLRGVDPRPVGTGVDPDAPRDVGSKQHNAFKSHDHGLVRGAKAPEIGNLERYDIVVGRDSARLKDGSKAVSDGDKETRPENLAVYYIIRAK
jgi:hypothetical protein